MLLTTYLNISSFAKTAPAGEKRWSSLEHEHAGPGQPGLLLPSHRKRLRRCRAAEQDDAASQLRCDLRSSGAQGRAAAPWSRASALGCPGYCHIAISFC